jgi:hypothetical protein
MAQDIGSAILAGIQGAQAMGQRRFQNQMAREELDLAKKRSAREEERLVLDREQLGLNKQANDRANQTQWFSNKKNTADNIGIDADRVDGKAKRLGYMKSDGSLDEAKLLADMRAGSPDALDFGVEVLNINKDVERLNRGDFSPRQFVFTGVDPKAFQEGRVVTVGQYADGKKGVFTLQGGDDPAEEVLAPTVDEAASQIAEAWRLRVNPYSNAGATNAQSRRLTFSQLGQELGDAADTRGNPYRRPVSPEQQVLAAIDQALPVEASRTFIGQLSGIKDPKERQEYLTEVAGTLGIELPKTETQGGFSSTKLAVEPEKVVVGGVGFSPFMPGGVTVTRGGNVVAGIDNQIKQKRERADRLPANSSAREKLETEITELNTKRADYIREENQRAWTGYEDQIKKADEAMAAPNVTAQSKAYWQSRKDDAEKKKSEFIKAGGRTPATQTVDYEALQNNVLSKIGGMSTTELKSAIDQGVIKFSDADMQALRARMSEVGVRPTDGAQITTRKLEKGLPRDEMIGAFAAMYAQTDNASSQQMLLQMMSNVIDTGSPSLSDAAQRQLQMQQQRINIDEMNSLRALQESNNRLAAARVSGAASDFNNAMKAAEQGFDVLFGLKDDKGRPREANMGDAQLWAARQLPLLQANVEYLARNGNVAQARQLYELTNGQVAAVTAVLADQMPQGFFKDIWYNWTGTRPVKDTMAKQLQNIRVETTGEGDNLRVKRVIMVNRGTGRQEGKELTAQSLQGVDGGPALFNMLATAGLLNESLRSAEAASNARGGR